MTLATSSQDVVSLAVGIDQLLDTVVDLIEGTDLTALATDVQQGLALTSAAGAVADRLLAALDVEDVDAAGCG
jgi:hypothetical protein